MNKKNLFSLIFIISLSCIWAVWEGNGGIGSTTDFPNEGLFVRSDMFPKHTLLEITNLEKNTKSRAVVIGPSGIPGLLLSLSPQLGNKLLVSKGKVIRIRVLTANPVDEIGDVGTSATSAESQDLDTNPALFVASHSDLPNTNLKPEKEKSETISNEAVPKDEIIYDTAPIKEELTVEETPMKEETSVEEKIASEAPPITAILDEKPEEEEALDEKLIPEKTEGLEEKPASDNSENEKTENFPIVEVLAETKPEEVPTKEETEEEKSIIESAVFEETVNEIPAIEIIAAPADSTSAVEEAPEPVHTVSSIEPEKKTVDNTPSESPIEVPPITEIYMEPAKENPPITVSSIIEPKKEKEATPSSVEEVTEPLPPTEPKEDAVPVELIEPIPESINSPPLEENEVEVIAEIEPKNDPNKDKEEIEEKTDTEEKTEFIENTETVETVLEDKDNSEDIYTVDIEEKIEDSPIETEDTPSAINEASVIASKLEKDKNYVQIIIYSDKNNCDELIENYGNQYPLVVEEGTIKSKKRYTVFIGPLKPQETGAVLERFKQLGFKDAFLKKGK